MYIISVFQIKVNIFISDMAYCYRVMIMVFERIRNIREDRDIRQRQVAEYLNVSQNTYSQYENGQRQLPIDVLIKLAKFYKVSTDYILELTDTK